MTAFKRYRRKTTKRALKPWDPIFTLVPHEIDAALMGGRR